MKICVLGNSVAIKMRPPRARGGDRTYSELLEARGYRVRNVSKAGVTLQEQFARLDDDVVTFFPDVLILHQGVIEVFFRRTIRRWNNAAITNYYLNGVYACSYRFDSLYFRASNLCWRALNSATRGGARLVGLRWQWQERSRFMEVVERTCALVLKETGAIVLVVGVTPPSGEAERDLPGLTDQVGLLNVALRECCAGIGERAVFLDTEKVLREGLYRDLVPDGIHFSAAGHALMARKIQEILAAVPAAG